MDVESVAEKCSTCRFWGLSRYSLANGGDDGDCGPHCDGSAGRCRRHSPTVVDRSRYPLATAVWPTSAREDWCGDYEARQHLIEKGEG